MGDWEGNTVLPASAPWEERKAEREAANAFLDEVGATQPRWCADDECDTRDVWHTHAGRRQFGVKKNRGRGRYST